MGGMESKQVVSSTTSNPLENIKRVLFVAVVILCTFFSAEAQRRVTQCSNVNQCSFANVVVGNRCVRSASYCAQSQPIYANICARQATRCLAYNYKNVVSCAAYANRCVQNQRYCSRSASYCVRSQPVYQFYCAQYGTRCVRNQVIKKQICVKHAAQKQCIAYKNVTTKYCKGLKTQCGAYQNVSVAFCNKMGKKCTKTSTSKVCTKHTKYCAQFKRTTQKYCKRTTLTGNCVSWKNLSSKVCSKYVNQCVQYRTTTKKVCKKTQPKCVRRAPAVKVCATWAYRLVNKGKTCQKWNPQKVTKKGTCLKYANKKICVNSQVCVKTHFNGTKVVKTEKSKPKCLKYKTVKQCTSKATKDIVTPKTCASWKAIQAKVKYCSKYTTKPGKCLQSVSQCIQYQTISNRVCAKYQKKCAAYKTVTKRVCAKKAPVCVEYGTKTISSCLRYANKCVAYKTVSKCHSYANVCTSKGIKIHRRCVRLDKVCAAHGTKTTRVCDKYRNTSKCVQYKTLTETKCAQTAKYCVRQAKRVTGNKCVQTGTRCVAYANRCVKSQRYCSRPVTRRVQTTCARSQAYCAAYTRRQTGTRCVRTATRCVQTAPNVQRQRRCSVRRVCRTVVVRGDPHILTEEGKDENSQFTGVFSYYKFKNLWIQVRFSKRHKGAVVTGVAVLRKRKNIWRLKYRAVVTKKRTLRVNFGKNKKSRVKVVKKGEEYTVGTTYGNLLVFFDKVTASISVEFLPKHGDGEGLVHNHKHFAKFVVKKKDSRLGKKFKYVKFVPKVHKRFAALAKAECEGTKYGVKLSERAVKDCKYDVMVTGEKFGRLYAKFQKDMARGDIDKAK